MGEQFSALILKTAKSAFGASMEKGVYSRRREEELPSGGSSGHRRSRG